MQCMINLQAFYISPFGKRICLNFLDPDELTPQLLLGRVSRSGKRPARSCRVTKGGQSQKRLEKFTK